VIFRAELAQKVLAGENTITRRLCSENPSSSWWRERCALRPGRSFAVQPGRSKLSIARARVTRVHREPLGWLSDRKARREGFATAKAFERAFAAINGAYDPAALVRRVAFELVAEVD
jgi:hypothetical protein